MGKCTICAWVTAVEPATDRLMVISWSGLNFRKRVMMQRMKKVT